MQIGRLEMMDQSKVDYVSKISQIQETDKKTKVDPDDKYQNELRKLPEETNEVMLDNIKFGFNEDTKEFFVRVTKGDSQYQFPTEDMMKLKQTLMEAYKNSQNQ
jgi:uncharacterized FlaG/YvyC family protein